MVILERCCTKDWKVPDTDCVLKPGDLVQINATAMMRDPAFFPDAKNFNPERNFGEEYKAERYDTNISLLFVHLEARKTRPIIGSTSLGLDFCWYDFRTHKLNLYIFGAICIG